MRMDSDLAKATTIIFLVTTFCLAGSAPANDPIDRLVAVIGFVYCETCSGTVIRGDKPVEGGVVKIKCKNATNQAELNVIVNDSFFTVLTSKIVDYAYTDCKAFLDQGDPRSSCNNPTDLNGGITGGELRPVKWSINISYPLYEIGPFTYRPICSL